ncbi:cinnamoyl-CoA reductase 1-like [Spinacia oleracea]|uniref:Cinnamoyl-CoA reductase 1-like n=1 Tax=Spinacia oleracea TaxID=3562 RepID=A0ABM3R2Z8_SPIOL|nr:cinnamoyl-CoA reductase 1-like [Spinacia oleracea]
MYHNLTKTAWEFSQKHGLDVVAINPGTCLGPLLQPGLNASCAVLQQLLQGSKCTQECHWLGAVHVKDVARAQVLLFETPAVSGRYLCTNGIYQFADFAAIVSQLFPEYPIHRLLSCYFIVHILVIGYHTIMYLMTDGNMVCQNWFTEETQPGLVACRDAAKRLIDLGLIFTPLEEAIHETVVSLKAKGFLEE